MRNNEKIYEMLRHKLSYADADLASWVQRLDDLQLPQKQAETSEAASQEAETPEETQPEEATVPPIVSWPTSPGASVPGVADARLTQSSDKPGQADSYRSMNSIERKATKPA